MIAAAILELHTLPPAAPAIAAAHPSDPSQPSFSDNLLAATKAVKENSTGDAGSKSDRRPSSDSEETKDPRGVSHDKNAVAPALLNLQQVPQQQLPDPQWSIGQLVSLPVAPAADTTTTSSSGDTSGLSNQPASGVVQSGRTTGAPLLPLPLMAQGIAGQQSTLAGNTPSGVSNFTSRLVDALSKVQGVQTSAPAAKPGTTTASNPEQPAPATTSKEAASVLAPEHSAVPAPVDPTTKAAHPAASTAANTVSNSNPNTQAPPDSAPSSQDAQPAIAVSPSLAPNPFVTASALETASAPIAKPGPAVPAPAVPVNKTQSIVGPDAKITINAPVDAKQHVAAPADHSNSKQDSAGDNFFGGQTPANPAGNSAAQASPSQSQTNFASHVAAAGTTHAQSIQASAPDAKVTASQASRTPDAAAATAPTAATGTAPAINSARLIQSINDTQLRVGMHSTEFGNISICTSAGRDAITAQISVDHGELAKAIAAHLPEMQSRLGNQAMEIRVATTSQASGQMGQAFGGMSQGSGGQGQGAWKQFSGASTGSFASSNFEVPPTPTAHVKGTEVSGLSSRLSVRA